MHYQSSSDDEVTMSWGVNLRCLPAPRGGEEGDEGDGDLERGRGLVVAGEAPRPHDFRSRRKSTGSVSVGSSSGSASD
jgi:hypothetical protein